MLAYIGCDFETGPDGDAVVKYTIAYRMDLLAAPLQHSTVASARASSTASFLMSSSTVVKAAFHLGKELSIALAITLPG